ncbi:MAG TPA: ABC transporter permease [Anaerolineae bacterium]|nr:ABC transporter permease [Anaerolineae bacterium]
MTRISERFKSWEGLLLVLLVAVVAFNIIESPVYLGGQNFVNLFQLSIEKIMVALVMTFIIINGEIDLSVASMMGLSACVLATLWRLGQPMVLCILVALIVGLIGGAFNGFWISMAGLPSLAVTLATLIMYRGLALVLLEDKSIGQFPQWFNDLGQKALFGPLPLALVIFFVGFILALVILQYSGFGRYVYVIGNNRDVARYSGVRVQRVKMSIFIASGFIAALAGIFLAARLGAVRGSTAEGFELDIITMVLLGGVSIFGGTGTLFGVLLSILLVLNLRNGMGLLNISGNAQTGVIGALLILSVLVPNLAARVQAEWNRRRAASQPPAAVKQAVSAE